jgi:hypothetical protein
LLAEAWDRLYIVSNPGIEAESYGVYCHKCIIETYGIKSARMIYLRELDSDVNLGRAVQCPGCNVFYYMPPLGLI